MNEEEFDYKNNLILCTNCAKDSKLKKYIQIQSASKKQCSFCKEYNTISLEIHNNIEFQNFLRAVIRYHYSEFDYNRHWGGERLEELLVSNNPIINHKRIVAEYIDEPIVWMNDIINDFKYDNSDPIGLYYGHSGGTRMAFVDRYKDIKSKSIIELQDQLLEVNYFLLEKDVTEMLNIYKNTFSYTLNMNETFYRARIGYKSVLNPEYNDIFSEPKKYKGYEYEDIGVPPIKKTLSGRLNRTGVSYLYLSTDLETSIVELRPHPGHIISVGCFKPIKELKIVDLDIAFIHYSKTESDMLKYVYLNHIDQLLQSAITPEDRHLYSITQFFADIFRKIGFDGIQFRSSIGEGENLLIFNPNTFEYIENSTTVHEINKLEYSSTKLRTIN